MKNKKHRIIERMLRRRIKQMPGEEDFWLISILRDDPDVPTWEEGFCVTGKYEKVIELTASIIAGMEAEPGATGGVRYDAYQGEDAAVSGREASGGKFAINRSEPDNPIIEFFMNAQTQNDGRRPEDGAKTTLINLHGQRVRPGDATIAKDGEVIINGWIYIGRKDRWLKIPESMWHNPFHEGRDGTREEVIKKFETYILADRYLRIHARTLKGRTLCCWCTPEPCHGDVLIRLVDQS
jgi:hypothetical protein